MNKILLVNKITQKKFLEYDSKVIPIIGDSILLLDKSLFTVWSRIISVNNSNIVLVGDIIRDNENDFNK